jgi:hypothetical protein
MNFLVGFLIAAAVGLTGIGGGSFTVPALVLLAGLTAGEAVSFRPLPSPAGTFENSPGWFICFWPNLILGKRMKQLSPSPARDD